jgi:tetratricopeptide (TPR) repeat protein
MNEHHLQEFLSRHPDCRLPLATLGIFPGPVAAPVLASLSTATEAPEVLRALTEKQWAAALEQAAEIGALHRADGGVYSVPPDLSTFLDSLLCGVFSNSLPSLEVAFAAAYASQARRFARLPEREQGAAARVWRTEEPNLLHALRLARTHGRWPEVADLLTALARFQTPGSPGRDWETVLREVETALQSVRDKWRAAPALEALWKARADFLRQRADLDGEWAARQRLKDHFEKRGDTAALATTLQKMGEVAAARQDPAQAEECYRRSLYLRCRLNDPGTQSELLRRLGSIARQQGRLETAAVWLSQGLAATEKLGDLGAQARMYLECGEVAQAWQKPERAEKFFLRCLETYERLNDQAGQAEAQERLGLLAMERSRFEEAGHWFRCQRGTCARLGLEAKEAEALAHLAHVAVTERRLDDAGEFFRQSMQIRVRLGDERGQAQSLCGLGVVAYERGQLAEAEQWFEQSLGLAERVGDEALQIRLLHNLGNAGLLRKELARAEQSYGLALKIAQRLQLEHDQTSLLYNLGRVAEEQKDFRRAAERYHESQVLAARRHDLPAQTKALQHLAELATKEERLEEAEAFYRQSLHAMDDHGSPRELAEIYFRLARLAEARGVWKDAEERYERCLALREQAGDVTGIIKTLDHFRALPNVAPEKVGQWFGQLLAQAERSGNGHIQCVVLHKLGDWAEKNGNWAEAERWYRRCLALEQAGGRKSDQSLLLLKLALVGAAQGRRDEAEKSYRLGVEMGALTTAERWLAPPALLRLGHLMCERAHNEDAMMWYQQCLKAAKDPAVRAEALAGLGRVALAQGDLPQAETWLEQALETAHSASEEPAAAPALLCLGALEQKRGEHRKASGHYGKALRLFEKAGVVAAQAEAHQRLGSLAEAQDHPDKAAEHYAQAATLFEQCSETQKLAEVRQALDQVRQASPGDYGWNNR